MIRGFVKIAQDRPTKVMKDLFEERTSKHIGLVKKYLDKLEEDYPGYDFEKDEHDASKFEDPEYEPYLFITWKHKKENEGEEYEIPDEWKDRCHEATFHHTKVNKHHPEYWDDTLTENPINKKDKDKPSGKTVDATKMPKQHVLEMVADWCAMSEELDKNTPKEWADENVGVRWKFSPEQEDLIYEAIEKVWNKESTASLRGIAKKEELFNAPPGTKEKDEKEEKKKKQPRSPKIRPREWENAYHNEEGTQTMLTSLPATFIPAPGGYQGRIASLVSKKAQYSSETLSEWQEVFSTLEGMGRIVNMKEELPTLWQELLVQAFNEGGKQLAEMASHHQKLTLTLDPREKGVPQSKGFYEDQTETITLHVNRAMVKEILKGNLELADYLNTTVSHEFKHYLDDQWKSQEWKKRYWYKEEKETSYPHRAIEQSAIKNEVQLAAEQMMNQGYDLKAALEYIPQRLVRQRGWELTHELRNQLEEVIVNTYERAVTGSSQLKAVCAARKLTIGIDIDGVIADFNLLLREIASQYIPIVDEDEDVYKLRDLKHGSRELEDKVMEEVYETHRIPEATTVKDAVKKINEIYDAGHRVIILTARGDHMYDQTEEWLKKIGLKYHELIHDNKKGSRAAKEGIDVFIDDKPENVQDLIEHGVEAYIFDQPWNRDVDAPRITGWKNVKAFVTKTAVEGDPKTSPSKRQRTKQKRVVKDPGRMRAVNPKRERKRRRHPQEGLSEEEFSNLQWHRTLQRWRGGGPRLIAEEEGAVRSIIETLQQLAQETDREDAKQWANILNLERTKLSSNEFFKNEWFDDLDQALNVALNKEDYILSFEDQIHITQSTRPIITLLIKNFGKQLSGKYKSPKAGELKGFTKTAQPSFKFKSVPQPSFNFKFKSFPAGQFDLGDVKRRTTPGRMVADEVERATGHRLPVQKAQQVAELLRSLGEQEREDLLDRMWHMSKEEVLGLVPLTQQEIKKHRGRSPIQQQNIRSFTKQAAPRWTTDEKNRLKELYLKYRARGVPHHIIYKAAAHLLGKSFLAVKQKLENMYEIDEELGAMKYEHWDRDKIDQMIQELYLNGQPISRMNLPANLMYQITNHSMPKAETCGFPAYYDSFDHAMASNILAVGFEREGDKLTENAIDSIEDALKYYRRKEKMAHTWDKDEIVALLQDAHVAGLPLTYSFFKKHPDIYKPLIGVGRSLEGLKDSIQRCGYNWSDLVIEAAPEYVDFYTDDGRLKPSTEELRIRRFLEINDIPFRTAETSDKIAVNDPELVEQGYKNFVPDFFILDNEGNTQAIVEVFGSVADSCAANTAELYREKRSAKEKFYQTLPYSFIAINNNTDGIDLTDEILKEKFNAFIRM